MMQLAALLNTGKKAGSDITTSLPHDGHFAEHLVDGWRGELEHFLQEGLPQLLFALLLAFIAWRIVVFFVHRMRKRADGLVANQQRASQLRTMAGILRATSYALIGFYLLTQVLGSIGVSLGPFIASAGVIGLGISFGAQSIFKDMLTGIFILVEDQYNVGDNVRIAGLAGFVEDLSLRVTKL
ncbi:MAG: mechanosensitive ion channel domain-containing protein, partial [Bryocella sp.]